jgi:hypothetical protein
MYSSIKSAALACVLLSALTGAWAGENPLVGTWALNSGTGERFYPLGENPHGYISYSDDGRMYTIQTIGDRIKPRELVPTDEERAKLQQSMIAYAGTYTSESGKLVHHIDISWNEVWTGTDQVRFYTVEGNTLTIKTPPLKNPVDGREGVAILVWEKVKALAR